MVVDSLGPPDAPGPNAEVVAKRVFDLAVVQKHIVLAGGADIEGERLGRNSRTRERIDRGIQARFRELEGAARAFAQIVVSARFQEPLADKTVDIHRRQIGAEIEFNRLNLAGGENPADSD